MKLAAIYNVWDGVELLRGSMDCMKNHVDLFIIIYQDVSNFGEFYNPLSEMDLRGINHRLVKYTPIGKTGFANEKNKRNLGIEIAKEEECTHFLHADCDEYYEDFAKAKIQYLDSCKPGSVCKLFTYFKKPIYRLETEDGYFVPFIHRLRHDSCAGVKQYPFYVDPTRRINEVDVALLNVHMHHFSWVRKDIMRKARNSSAKMNIENGTIVQDYFSIDVKEGFYVKDFTKKLIKVTDQFNISPAL